jgi:hypothetical protein
MALSAARKLEFQGEPEEIDVQVAGNDTYYEGALLIADSDGYAAVPTDAAGLIPLGIVAGKYEGGISDSAYAVASGAHPKAKLLRGKVWLPFSGAQSDVGENFYLADDGTITQTAGSKTVILRPIGFKTGHLLFDLRQYQTDAVT